MGHPWSIMKKSLKTKIEMTTISEIPDCSLFIDLNEDNNCECVWQKFSNNEDLEHCIARRYKKCNNCAKMPFGVDMSFRVSNNYEVIKII